MREAVLLLVFGCATPGEETGLDEAPVVTDPAVVYERTCEGCHGADGDAGIQVGGVPATDLAESVPSLYDQDLRDVILNGVGEMPGQALTPAQIEPLILWLRERFPEGSR